MICQVLPQYLLNIAGVHPRIMSSLSSIPQLRTFQPGWVSFVVVSRKQFPSASVDLRRGRLGHRACGLKQAAIFVAFQVLYADVIFQYVMM